MEQKKKGFCTELHLHTAQTSPCANLPADEAIRLYAEEGYDGVVITDHFIATVEGSSAEVDWQTAVDRFLAGYTAAKAAGKQAGLSVFLGMEIRFPSNMNDYLVYGVEEPLLRENEWLYELELPEFFQFAEKNGLFVVQAHPFRDDIIPADPHFLHGVEVYNGHKGHNSRNPLAKAFAEENHLIGTAGSDCHYAHAVGTAAVCLKQQPQTNRELARLLKQGAFWLETGRKGE